MAKTKEFQIIYKFSDVIKTIMAETLEEADQIANEYFKSPDEAPIKDTNCYNIEIEEIKEE